MADSLIERAAVAIHRTCETPGSYPADPRNPRSVYGRAARWLATLGLLADPEQGDELADRKQFLRDVVAERDLALWLHAEAQWHLEGAANGWTEQHKRADNLQARIDRTVDALQVVGDDFTDWQVGYRAASEQGIAALTTAPA